MKNVNITFRMDDEVKKEAEDLFSDLGMSMSTAFNIFIKQSIREQRIPFEITKEVPNKTTLKAIEDAENCSSNGPYESIDSLMEALNA